MVWVRKYRLWAVLAALVIIAMITIRPMFWLGIIGFIGLMLLLAIVVGLLATCILSLKTDWYLKSVFFLLLTAAIVFPVIALKYEAPDLSASDVKTIMYQRHNGWVTSVEYKGKDIKGDGIWRVRMITKGIVLHIRYNESTGSTEYEY